METHSCMNVTLFKHDYRRRRREKDRNVLGDTSRVGDVTGKRKATGVAALVFCCPKHMERKLT